MLERLARWYLRRHLIDCEIAKGAAWNEGFQAGYRMGRKQKGGEIGVSLPKNIEENS